MPHPKFNNGLVRFYQADAREIPLKDGTVHCVVTSPPYYGLRVYKDNDDRGIGLESSMEAYIANLVEVFREVWRVMRDDGVCWINLGDSYAGSGKGQNGDGTHAAKHGEKQHTSTGTLSGGLPTDYDLDAGNRLGIPERVVLALQADGWVWRDTVIWAKKSAMPESMAGWRWERCRVKVANGQIMSGTLDGGKWKGQAMNDAEANGLTAQYTDCPGCPKCADTDGLVLRKGSWRCTSAHEYIYMLTKSMGYYADGEAVKHRQSRDRMSHVGERSARDYPGGPNGRGTNLGAQHGNANRRSVWSDISPEPYGGSHFATFPSDLPRICIQASTSERGCCPKCGSQITRIIDKPIVGTWHDHTENLTQGGRQNGAGPAPSYEAGRTVGWRPSCGHTEATERPDPALVLDPFMGTGTTALAAMRLGRRCVGTELSEDYLGQARKRLSEQSLPLPLAACDSGHYFV